MENNNQVNGESLVEELRTELQEIDAMKSAIMPSDLKPYISASIRPCHQSMVYKI